MLWLCASAAWVKVRRRGGGHFTRCTCETAKQEIFDLSSRCLMKHFGSFIPLLNLKTESLCETKMHKKEKKEAELKDKENREKRSDHP